MVIFLAKYLIYILKLVFKMQSLKEYLETCTLFALKVKKSPCLMDLPFLLSFFFPLSFYLSRIDLVSKMTKNSQ